MDKFRNESLQPESSSRSNDCKHRRLEATCPWPSSGCREDATQICQSHTIFFGDQTIRRSQTDQNLSRAASGPITYAEAFTLSASLPPRSPIVQAGATANSAATPIQGASDACHVTSLAFRGPDASFRLLPHPPLVALPPHAPHASSVSQHARHAATRPFPVSFAAAAAAVAAAPAAAAAALAAASSIPKLHEPAAHPPAVAGPHFHGGAVSDPLSPASRALTATKARTRQGGSGARPVAAGSASGAVRQPGRSTQRRKGSADKSGLSVPPDGGGGGRGSSSGGGGGGGGGGGCSFQLGGNIGSGPCGDVKTTTFGVGASGWSGGSGGSGGARQPDDSGPILPPPPPSPPRFFAAQTPLASPAYATDWPAERCEGGPRAGCAEPMRPPHLPGPVPGPGPSVGRQPPAADGGVGGDPGAGPADSDPFHDDYPFW